MKPGDHVLVRPGDRIAVDGEVLEGRSEVDASLVTGETAREIMTPGPRVYAGTVNVSGALTVVVTAAAEGTLLEEVNRLVETAASARSRYLRLADRAARIYSPVVHLTAFATAIGWLLAGAGLHQAIITAIAVLIITCPCALALAVPATQVVASGTCSAPACCCSPARRSSGSRLRYNRLRQDGHADHARSTRRQRAEIDPALLGIAARLALSSRHPLAAALAMEARGMRAFSGASEQAGHGVSAIVDGEEARLGSAAFCDAEAQAASALAQFPDATVICFSHRAERAVILLHQLVRPDAVAVVGELKRLGYRLAILSGDRERPVAQVASLLGIETFAAGLKPADKIDALAAMAAEGQRVLMVGDGLNDAPALAAAHASISPVTAAHLAQASADALFLGDRLAPVMDAMRISRRAVGSCGRTSGSRCCTISSPFRLPLPASSRR